ncbi:MAG: efflux RND transporter periplasmic adaptor subunit [Candidatus Protochlamydia sp.]|nr:efflux RND transporter periplasmic adaptor subunit [Candidatus Protochlamydia sp.]
MRSHWIYFCFSLLVVLEGCSQKNEGPPAGFVRPLPVIVQEVIQKDVPVYVEAIGNATASWTVNIKAQVSGKVIDTPIEKKSDVQVGDLLYRIDPVPYKLALEKARANLLKDEAELEYAKKKVERYETLVRKDFVSKLSIEEYQRDAKVLEAQIQIDKSEVAAAETNLNYCNIFSPLDGRVGFQRIKLGNVVSPADQNPMATILQISPIDIYFSISQREFEELQQILAEGKNTFRAILPGTGQDFTGELTAIDNQVDTRTGTIQIKGSIKNRERVLWPGEFVRVQVFIRMVHNAIMIPFQAVQVGQGGSFVYVLGPEDKVKHVTVKTGRKFDNLIVVEEGLEPGMQVVTDGQINLRPDVKVAVSKEDPQNEKGNKSP